MSDLQSKNLDHDDQQVVHTEKTPGPGPPLCGMPRAAIVAGALGLQDLEQRSHVAITGCRRRQWSRHDQDEAVGRSESELSTEIGGALVDSWRRTWERWLFQRSRRPSVRRIKEHESGTWVVVVQQVLNVGRLPRSEAAFESRGTFSPSEAHEILDVDIDRGYEVVEVGGRGLVDVRGRSDVGAQRELPDLHCKNFSASHLVGSPG